MPPPPSPSRRVLGEKNANASLNITSPRAELKASLISAAIPSANPRSSVVTDKPSLPISSARAGRKRSIAEVEGVDVQDWIGRPKTTHTTELLSDDSTDNGSNNAVMNSSAILMSQSMTNTNMTSFSIHGSQELLPQNSLEQHFELMGEEMSQKTLEKIHAVPLPQNTSQPVDLMQEVRPVSVTRASQGSTGMSSLVDFDGSDASQRSDGLEMIAIERNADEITPKSLGAGAQPVAVQLERSRKGSVDDRRRRAMLEEKAAQLRIRLQLAYFKVQTNQTTRSLSRLKVPKEMRKSATPPPAFPARSSYIPDLVPNHNRVHQIDPRLNSELYVSAMRSRATAQPKPTVRSLNSLPMPSIQPTGFSARFAEETVSHTRPSGNNEVNDPIQIPSSPPIPRLSAEAEEELHQDESQLPPPPKTPATVHVGNEQLSSPPPSQDGDDVANDDDVLGDNVQIMKRRRVSRSDGNRGLTSSVVKGEAADGLLQLMRGGNSQSAGPRAGGKGWCGV